MDIITGQELDPGDRVVTTICVLLPIINGKTVRIVKKGFSKISNVLHYGDVNTINKVRRLSNVAEAVDDIKDTLKAEPEEIFENIKSVVVNGDEVTITKMDGLEFADSKSALKNDLLEEGLNNEAVDNAMKCLTDGCFSGDTQVMTKSGLKRIDQIQEGEYVLAKDVNNNIIDYREVKQVYIKSTYEFIHLKLEDEEIKTTASHLFFTDSGWWKAARNLKPGDQIVNSKGELKTLLSTSLEELDQPESIYNLNVDEFHTYFVGSQGLLVHNDCTADMMAAGREAIEKARLKGITDSKFLSDIGSASAEAIERAVARGVTDSTELARIGKAVGDAVSSIKVLSHFDEIAQITDLVHLDDATRAIAKRLRNMIESGEIRKITGGKIDANVVNVVVDKITGKVYYGISGFSQNPTRRAEIFGFLQDRIKAVGEPLMNYPLDNCGEFNAINNALFNGCSITNLLSYSIRIYDGIFWPACDNCHALYDGFITYLLE